MNLQSHIGRDVDTDLAMQREPTSGVLSIYRAIFSVEEIATDVTLKWLSGAILLGFLVTFSTWMNSALTTVQAVKNSTYLCWPFFQSCKNLIFLSSFPEGYSQAVFYMILFGLIASASYAIYLGRWMYVHLAILFLFFAKIYLLLISYGFKGNYEYYHNFFCFTFLFCANKKFFAQLGLVFFYFLSTAGKIHPSWLLGQYFTALKEGLPIFPFGTEALMTNLVIAMEMVGCWFLFSRNPLIQRSVFAFFVAFHLYSGTLVGYRYPSIVMPPLLILFGPWFQAPERVPVDRRSAPGWLSMICLVVLQLIPHMIRGDEKLTLEGNFYGLYMFEANHQCYGSISRDGKPVLTFAEVDAVSRCDPYDLWFRAKHRYCAGLSAKYGMILNHSINGEPFREIVNEPDVCTLVYHPFSRNSWIKDEKEAPAVARPVQNFFR
ncbi:hypothetical protein [Bradyrhizobium roseum]|uniref:hypothetical protein n=1 Tax=Bradyrhizobium roseum TaxID=3056648 RepID=UPI002609D626|nr:hypothetical protein [Bradyrhizobium roseus]WKA26406.1 hypothetical protein QUH67_22735 [Bradyrhizobium roseus]